MPKAALRLKLNATRVCHRAHPSILQRCTSRGLRIPERDRHADPATQASATLHYDHSTLAEGAGYSGFPSAAQKSR
jgi:hypothetical protein